MMPAAMKGGYTHGLPGPFGTCITPSPSGPHPIPYPNGSYEVKNSAGKTLSNKKVSGDEVGGQGGVVSSATMGKHLGNIPLLIHVVDKAGTKGYKVVIDIANGNAFITLRLRKNQQATLTDRRVTVPLGRGTSATSSVLRRVANSLR